MREIGRVKEGGQLASFLANKIIRDSFQAIGRVAVRKE
jgi:hypothetical protein